MREMYTILTMPYFPVILDNDICRKRDIETITRLTRPGTFMKNSKIVQDAAEHEDTIDIQDNLGCSFQADPSSLVQWTYREGVEDVKRIAFVIFMT